MIDHEEITRVWLQTKASIHAYRADLAVLEGYCENPQCHRRRSSNARTCKTCRYGKKKEADRQRQRRLRAKEKK